MNLIPWDGEPGSLEEIRRAFGDGYNWGSLVQWAPDIAQTALQIYGEDYEGALRGAHKYFRGAYDGLRTRPHADNDLDAYLEEDNYRTKQAQKAKANARPPANKPPLRRRVFSRRGYRRAGNRRRRMRYQYYGYVPPKTPYYYRYL
jgi:hypothetical protein